MGADFATVWSEFLEAKTIRLLYDNPNSDFISIMGFFHAEQLEAMLPSLGYTKIFEMKKINYPQGLPKNLADKLFPSSKMKSNL